MSIKVFYGLNKKKLTDEFIEQINDANQNSKASRLIVVIPEQFSSYYEERLAMDKGFMRVEVMTFSRLTQRLFDIEYIQRSNSINEIGKTMLLYSLLNEDYIKLDYYNRSRRFPGFSVLMKKTIEDLKNNDISYLDLMKLIEADNASDISRRKFFDLSKIFEGYLNRLSDKGYSDQSDAFSFLCEHIKNKSSFDNCIIWFDRFDSFTSNEFDVIRQLMLKAERINISLCMDKNYAEDAAFDKSIFKRPTLTYNKIKEESQNLNISFFENKVFDKKEHSSKEIKFLFENMFNTNFKSSKVIPKNISIFKATDIYEEVEYTAAKIMDAVTSRNIRFKDILLVTGDISLYEMIAKAVFSQYDIPFYVNTRKNISDNPLIHFIISILDIYIWDYSYQHMTRFFKSIYSNLTEKESFELENYILKWGISGKTVWHTVWDYENSSYDIKMNELRLSVIQFLDLFFDSIKGGCTAETFANNLYQLTEKMKVSEKIEKLSLYMNNDEIEQSKQCYNSFIDILDQLVIITENEKKTAEYFLNILKTAFLEETVGVTPMTKDCVFLTSSSRTDIVDYDTVFILGANDGSFPMTVNYNNLLNDSDYDLLKENGYEISSDPKEKIDEQEYITYTLLQSPNKYLYLSYCINNTEGGYLFPALIITKIYDIFTNIHTLTKEDIPQSYYAFNLKTGFNLLYSNKQSIHQYCSGTEFEKFFDSLEDASGLTNKEMSDLIFNQEITITATMLERYMKCPYSFLMAYGLKLDERSEFEYFSKNLGTLKHIVLFDVMNKVCNYEKEYNYDEIYAICEESAESISRINNIYRRDSILEYVKKRAVLQTAETVKVSLDILKDEKLKPRYFEAEFNDGQQLPAVIIENENVKIKITGKIDRVDSTFINNDEYFRIIDYKSSDKDTYLYKIEEGHDIQLALYAYAYHKAKNANLTGMYYMTVKEDYVEISKTSDESYKDNERVLSGYSFEDKDQSLFDIVNEKNIKKRKIVDKQIAEKIFSSLEKTIIRTGERIKEGNFEVYPLNDNREPACKYCEYKNLCGFDSSKGRYRVISPRKDDEIEW
ncbi:MAG: hypothetical protein GX584_04230 [Clostridiaceae bacterium]|nr:hypothetical protein [Clostridiaceae bacterium]